MELFLHNLVALIPNLPHAKLNFFFPHPKIKKKMAAKISKNVTNLHHDLAYNEHENIILVSKITFLESGNSVMMFPKVI